MVIQLLTTATGTTQSTENNISWEHVTSGPAVSGSVLLVFIGAVDSHKPSSTAVIFSGTGVSPIPVRALDSVVEINGPGGISYPCGFVYSLIDPVTGTETVTGTIVANFDRNVGSMSGMSAIFVGGSGVLDGGPASNTILTQLPDYRISQTYTTSAANSLVVDLCMSESSNHNDHILEGGQTELGHVFFGGARLTTSYSGVSSPGTITMTRSGAGGPYAGATLIAIALEDKP